MNKIHRIVWSAARGAFVVAHELARAGGKTSTRSRTPGACLEPTAGAESGLRASALTMAVCLAVAGVTLPVSTWAQPAANALPTGGQIVGGNAAGSIASAGNAMTVTQNQQRMIANWNSFSIGSAASVNFQQPTGGVALNRVTGNQPSEIFGRLTSNGSVYLINPNGVLFGRTAEVDVGSLAASTQNMSDADFMAGKALFSRNGSTGSVVNEGQINAALGGYIALLAPEVRNGGVIVARMGTVVMAAGDAVELQFDGSKLANVRVDPATIASLIDNRNAVQAPDGQIILSAPAVSKLQASAIRNSGTLDASSLTQKGGRIVLTADDVQLSSTSVIGASGATGGGTVLVGGDWQGSNGIYQATTVSMAAGAKIDASATQNGDGGKVVLWSDVQKANGHTSVAGSIKAEGAGNQATGGNVETSGHQLTIASSASVKTGGGEWLLDPLDITIDTSLANTIQTALTSGNVTVTTSGSNTPSTSSGESSGNGDMFVNASINWNQNKLTLQAGRYLTISAPLNVTGSGGFAGSSTYTTTTQNPGRSFIGKINFNASGWLQIDGTSYTVVNSAADLDHMVANSNYALGSDITLTGNWTPVVGYYGRVNGLGHTISGLNTSTRTADNSGLFATTTGITRIENLGLIGANIGGYNNVGGFIGSVSSNTATLNNVFVDSTSTVVPDTSAATRNAVGGMVGLVDTYGTIILRDAYNAAAVHGGSANTLNYVGGLVGRIMGGSTSLNNSANSGEIVGGNPATKNTPSSLGYAVGGLFGSHEYYFSGNQSNLRNTGAIYGGNSVGGIGGFARSASSAIMSYLTNTGSITGDYYVGGLFGQYSALDAIGNNTNNLTLSNSYNKGDIKSTSTIAGGLIGVLDFRGGAYQSSVATFTLDQSFNSGSITGLGTGAGGLIGNGNFLGVINCGSNGCTYNTLSSQYIIQDSYNAGAVRATSAGSIFGYLIRGGAGVVRRYYNTGTLSGTNVGEIAGYVDPYNLSYYVFIENSYHPIGYAAFGINANTNVALGTNGSFSTNALTSLPSGFSSSIWSQDAGVNGGHPYLSQNMPTTRITIAVDALSMTYGGVAPTLAGHYTVTGCDSCVALGWGSLLGATTNAGSYAYSTTNLLTPSFGSGNASDYSIVYSASNAFTVNQKSITLSGTKVYDSLSSIAYSALSVASGVVNGDSVSVSSGSATMSGKDVGGHTLTDMSGLTLSNSNYTLTGGSGSVTVSKRDLQLNATKTYDGTTTLGSGTVTLGGLQNGETLNYSDVTLSDANVATANKYVTAITLANGTGDINNYQLPSLLSQGVLNNATINKATLTVSGSKTYDGGIGMPNQLTLGGFVGNETVGYSSATISNSHVATVNKYVNSITLTDGDNGGLASNYQINAGYDASTNHVAVNAATLTPTISNTGVTKVYDGSVSTTLTPTYTFSGLIAGDTTATLTNTSKAYNSKDVASANQITVSGLAISGVTGNNNSQSTDYVLDSSSKTVAASVTAKALTVSGLGSQNKTYDGTTTATVTGTAALQAAIAPGTGSSGDGKAYTNDAVNLSGTAVGDFNSKNVTGATSVAFTGLSLSGADAGNYTLTQHANNTTARITPKTLTVNGITASDKAYDGARAANVNTSDVSLQAGGMVAGDSVTVSSVGTFSDKNVGTGKTVSLVNTYGGTDLGNYTVIDQASTTASITRLASVAWIGGTTGNWFNPANWAGGAVPDLANVAQVSIPANVVVSFNNANLSGQASGGTVQIDGLGSAQGGLNMQAGTLQVGTSGVTLNALSQSGGTLTSTGAVDLGTFAQTGGSAQTSAGFSASTGYSQSGPGTVTVGGTTTIGSTSGNVSLGNLSTGALVINNQGGSVGQSAGTHVSSGTTTVTARNANGSAADITLGNAGNDLGGTVSTDGANVTLRDDTGGLTLGDTTATGTLTVDSHGGRIDQAVGTALNVTGTTQVTALDGSSPADITLGSPSNRFGGLLTANGRDVNINADGPLDIDVTASGTATVSASGNLNATLAVTGDASLTSGGDLNLGGRAGNLQASSAGTVNFRALDVDGALSVSAKKDITQTGPLSVGGQASFKSEIGTLILSENNQFSGGLIREDNVSRSSAANVVGVISGTGNVPGLSTGSAYASGNTTSTTKTETSSSTITTNVSNLFASAGITGATVAVTLKTAGEQSSIATGFSSIQLFDPTTVPAATGFNFTLPQGTFKHVDPKMAVSLEATGSNGQPLPDWLKFDAGTGRFTGQPPEGVRELDIRVTAHAAAGGDASTSLMLRFGDLTN